jgi:hypothetical protein
MFSDFGYGNGGGILTAEYKVAAERESAFFFSFLLFFSFFAISRKGLSLL